MIPHDEAALDVDSGAQSSVTTNSSDQLDSTTVTDTMTVLHPPKLQAPTHHDAEPKLDGDRDTMRSRAGGRFIREPLGLPASDLRSSSQSPFRLQIPSISPAQLAFSALQYLPIPTIVLNNLKTVVLANEAMGRMMGIVTATSDDDDPSATTDRLRGQTLSQVGIDMLQDGRPVWVTWEIFLDTLVDEMRVRVPLSDVQQQQQSEQPYDGGGEATPTAANMSPSSQRRKGNEKTTQDAVVEVVVSHRDMATAAYDTRTKSKDADHRTFAKMIITMWEIENKQTYFTLTFTNTQSAPSSLANTKKLVARPNVLEAAERRTIRGSNPPSVASSRDSNSPSFHSPGLVTMSSSPFPPMGPPSAASYSSTPSLLQKMTLMKDALLDNTEIPILAMWKDRTASFPNKAARKLFHGPMQQAASKDESNLLSNWHLWKEDFSEVLPLDQHPMAILIRDEVPFSGLRIGMYSDDGKKRVLDVLGEAIRDDVTGEFLAGVVTGRDVTEMTEEITQIKERDDERFRLICDTMPQLVWTTNAEGLHDFFNAGWYDYTGLTPETSMGQGWQNPFHPDDMPETTARWKHSLATGEPYVTEYRCRRKDGEWRWFLGRALAARNKDTGEIEKWFGGYIFMRSWHATPLICIVRHLYRCPRKYRDKVEREANT